MRYRDEIKKLFLGNRKSRIARKVGSIKFQIKLMCIYLIINKIMESRQLYITKFQPIYY